MVYYIGVDFGTANTKVCVREDIAQLPSAVPVDLNANSTARYLLPSTDSSWTDRDPPKVILLQQRTTINRDHEAMTKAIDVVTRAARSAVEFVRTQTGTSAHEFVLNLGYPSVFEADPGDVVDRYDLIANAVADSLQESLRSTGASVQLGTFKLDERSAALVHLSKSRYELRTEPMLLVDGGGYTLHMTVVRWRDERDGFGEIGFSVHGAKTVLHGVNQVISSVLNALEAVRPGTSPSDAAEVVEAVLKIAYSEAKFSQGITPDVLSAATLRGEQFVGDVIRRASSSGIACLQRGAPLLVESVLGKFASFVTDPLVAHAWEQVWKSAWLLSPRMMFWRRFPLLMMGGACRAGRSMESGHRDPLSTTLVELQKRRRVADFTGVIYPELDERFWLDPQPSPELKSSMPFLFVAAGYTHPEPDWPTWIKAEPVPPPPPPSPPPPNPLDDG